MRVLSSLVILLAFATVLAIQNPEIAVYGGGPFYPARNSKIQENINILKASGVTTVIGWSLHIYGNGDIVYNGDKLVSNGQYVGDKSWAGYLKQLKQGKTSVKKIHLSVGSAGVKDFATIGKLIKEQGNGPISILYKNFAALKKELPMIDTIDLDNEDSLVRETVVQFSLLLGKVGFKVSFCPYHSKLFWLFCLKDVNTKHKGLVTHFNLQVYDGGRNNNPVEWQNLTKSIGFSIPVYAGVMTKASGAGGDDQTQIQNKFKTWGKQGIKGGFFWLFDNMGASTASYVTALKKGLN